MTIPGELGRGTVKEKVAAFADDVKCYCANMADVCHLTDPDPRVGPIA